MSPRARVFLLVTIMTGITMGVAGITLWTLYSAAFECQKARLRETARSQAGMIETIAAHEARYAHRMEDVDDHGGTFSAMLWMLRRSHQQFGGAGDIG